MRVSASAKLFGARLATRRAVPRKYFLASMSDPKLLALMIPSLGTLNNPGEQPGSDGANGGFNPSTKSAAPAPSHSCFRQLDLAPFDLLFWPHPLAIHHQQRVEPFFAQFVCRKRMPTAADEQQVSLSFILERQAALEKREYVRFIIGRKDEDSHVEQGIFQAAAGA